MSADPPGLPHRRRRAKRSLLIALGIAASAGLGLLAYQQHLRRAENDGDRRAQRSSTAVSPVEHKPATALGIEYHFDRNAMLDSRIVEARILGLAASGNLVSFDAETFALGNDKVLHRRATCLGPAQGGAVLAGIANGCIVKVAIPELAIERVADVPGVPRWIGRLAKDGSLLVAYQRELAADGTVWLNDLARNKRYEIGAATAFFLDSQDRLWFASDDRVFCLNLESSRRTEVEWQGGWPGVRGFAEVADGQVWVFGGLRRGNAPTSFVARVSPGKRTVLYLGGDKPKSPFAPLAPVTHVIEDGARILVVALDGVAITDRNLGTWQPLNPRGGARREDDALTARGQAHRIPGGVLLTLARGGFMQLTAAVARRHLLRGQNPVAKPNEIVRLEKGLAFFGDGGPSFYTAGEWRALPDPVVPPAELMGPARPGEKERVWAAMLVIPLAAETSYLQAKAGPPRHYLGHIHGLRDTVLTGRWDGRALTVLGREDLPIEPADTFTTPDRRLWNVDDQGLWSFSGGRWQMVVRATSAGHGKSAIGDPLHFAETTTAPFYGLPKLGSSWALARLDSNEEGGIPLIDEVPVTVGGERVLVHDLTTWNDKQDELLLATDHGICVFATKWGTCHLGRPAGLADEARLFKRDSSRRLWMAGRGLWVLRDLEHAIAVHPDIPMLADTRVLAMAEAADGRLVLGLEDRGTVFLTLPPGWLDRPPRPASRPVAWEATPAHEPAYQDHAVVLRECREEGQGMTDATRNALLAELRGLADAIAPRVRVGTEAVFVGRPDIVVRGADPDHLLKGVLSVLGKYRSKAHLGVGKRLGARGSEVIEVLSCPKP